jgi:predicted small integral membrane protein
MNRNIKIIFSLLLSTYAAMIFLNNVVDYQTNFLFVKAIVVMDELISGDTNKWRSVNQPSLQHLLFIIILCWEGVMAVCFGIGTWNMYKNRNAEAASFNQSKKWTIIGLALGIGLWFGVFTIAAGEWFLIWQSKFGSTQVTGFLLCGIFLLFLLFISQKDE